MESFPEWVPPSVVDYYNSVPNPFKPDLNLEPEEIEFLRKVMSAVDMKKAWEAISKRSDIVDPSRFAYSIASVHCMTRSIDRFATPENISDIYDLAEQTQELAAAVARKARRITGEDWFDERRYPLRAILKVPPYQALCELAEYFELTARDMEEERTYLTAYVGKPGSPDARRHYMIRLLSETMTRLYDRPLHNVVASVASTALDESIDTGLVRKLVKLGENRPPPYWAG